MSWRLADIVQHSRHQWAIDFGLMDLAAAQPYELPFEHERRVVFPVRSKNRRNAYARRWWQTAEARPGMRAALVGKSRFIATPGVSLHRIFVWVEPSVLCNQKNMVFAREDSYFFGVLHSRLHEAWVLANAARHGVGNDPTYNIGKCFETFPFPFPPDSEPKDDPRVIAIGEAAANLVTMRNSWLNPADANEAELKKRTLTNLYNQRPTWLDNAHRRLDEAVFGAYGWPADLSDDEILVRLLALNLERAAAQGAVQLKEDAGGDSAEDQ
jgi:type II restriction/modification system DNA methylase subunit YeeA